MSSYRGQVASFSSREASALARIEDPYVCCGAPRVDEDLHRYCPEHVFKTHAKDTLDNLRDPGCLACAVKPMDRRFQWANAVLRRPNRREGANFRPNQMVNVEESQLAGQLQVFDAGETCGGIASPHSELTSDATSLQVQIANELASGVDNVTAVESHALDTCQTDKALQLIVDAQDEPDGNFVEVFPALVDRAAAQLRRETETVPAKKPGEWGQNFPNSEVEVQKTAGTPPCPGLMEKLQLTWSSPVAPRKLLSAYDQDTKVVGWDITTCPPPPIEKELAAMLVPGQIVDVAKEKVYKLPNKADQTALDSARVQWDSALQGVRAVSTVALVVSYLGRLLESESIPDEAKLDEAVRVTTVVGRLCAAGFGCLGAVMANSVVNARRLWLKDSTLKEDVQRALLNAEVRMDSLFGVTDPKFLAELKSGQDTRESLSKALGVQTATTVAQPQASTVKTPVGSTVASRRSARKRRNKTATQTNVSQATTSSEPLVKKTNYTNAPYQPRPQYQPRYQKQATKGANVGPGQHTTKR